MSILEDYWFNQLKAGGDGLVSFKAIDGLVVDHIF